MLVILSKFIGLRFQWGTMPVNRPDPDNQEVDPYRRLSASQVIAWKNCPRLWYYGWIEKLKTPLPPQILRGNAVEECVCRVLRESPSLIDPDSGASLRTPLAEDGSPELQNQDLRASWAASRGFARATREPLVQPETWEATVLTAVVGLIGLSVSIFAL